MSDGALQALCLGFSTLLPVLAYATHAAPLTSPAVLKLAEVSAPLLQGGTDVRAAQSSAIAARRLPDPKFAFGWRTFRFPAPLGKSAGRGRFQLRGVRAKNRSEERQCPHA